MVSPALAAAPGLTFVKKFAVIRHYNEVVVPKVTGSQEEKSASDPTDYGDVFSRLSFWYGLGAGDLGRECHLRRCAPMGERLPARLAELKLMLAEVFMLPYMEQRDQQRLLSDWRETAGHRERNTRS